MDWKQIRREKILRYTVAIRRSYFRKYLDIMDVTASHNEEKIVDDAEDTVFECAAGRAIALNSHLQLERSRPLTLWAL